MKIVLDLAPPADQAPLERASWSPIAERLERVLAPLTPARPGLHLVSGAAGVIVSLAVDDDRAEFAAMLRQELTALFAGTEFAAWTIAGLTLEA